MKKITVVLFLSGLWLVTGCAPKVGSDTWCEQMKEKSKADWSVNEAKDFARYCVLK